MVWWEKQTLWSHTALVCFLSLPFNSRRSLSNRLLNFVSQFPINGTACKMKILIVHTHKVIGRNKLVNTCKIQQCLAQSKNYISDLRLPQSQQKKTLSFQIQQQGSELSKPVWESGSAKTSSSQDCWSVQSGSGPESLHHSHQILCECCLLELCN